MKLLVLGGSRFLGRHLVNVALSNNHEVTIFNRGKTNPTLFPDVEHLIGDRDGDLQPLHNRKWDVVIDTCGYVPRIVRKSARLLCDAVEQYIFVSSISVYADFTKPGTDERSALAAIEDESVEQVTSETYGALKALCEKEAERTMPGRVLSLRPGLIVGPYDPTDRFTYWPVRIKQGGGVLAPSPPELHIQFIDVRDLVDFTLLMAEKRYTGILNATGPADTLTMLQFLDECKITTNSSAVFIWVDEKLIVENDVDLPVWVPKEWTGINQINCRRAINEGLRFRPLVETINDTLDWFFTHPPHYVMKAGLKPDREEELLIAWSKKNIDKQ